MRSDKRRIFTTFAGLLLFSASGCRYTPTSKMEAIESSIVNQNASYRASVLRESTNAALASDWTFVYLTKGSMPLNKKPGDMIVTAQIVFEIAGAWPININWIDHTHLQIVCDGCGAPLTWATKKNDRLGDIAVTYSDFPSVPHELKGIHLDNPVKTFRAEQYYYALPDTPIADSITVRIRHLPVGQDDRKMARVDSRWPEDILELRKTKPLTLKWSDDKTLVVSCDHCGGKLSDATIKVDCVYGIQVRFEGFTQ